MGIGIVSDEELQAELDKLNRVSSDSIKPRAPEVLKPEVIDIPTRGRNNGDNNVPNSLRKIIGETGAIDGRQEAIALAEMFDVSPSSVSAYTNGATSTTTYNKPKKSILEHINRHKERIVKKASSRLNTALDQITDEKLSDLSASKLAGIARDMSAIVKDMTPEVSERSDEDKPRFIVYAPAFIKEEHFETVILKDEIEG